MSADPFCEVCDGEGWVHDDEEGGSFDCVCVTDPPTSHADLTAALAAVLCPDTDTRPCARCEDAAYRIVVHRREVRRLLTTFAEREADLPVASGASAAKRLNEKTGDAPLTTNSEKEGDR